MRHERADIGGAKPRAGKEAGGARADNGDQVRRLAVCHVLLQDEEAALRPPPMFANFVQRSARRLYLTGIMQCDARDGWGLLIAYAEMVSVESGEHSRGRARPPTGWGGASGG